MKKYLFELKGAKGILSGMNIATDCVAPTLGAAGKKAILDAGHLNPIVADDGGKILNMIDIEDRWEQMGNRLMRKVVNEMHQKAKSGRTTSVVLARAFCNACYDELKKGTHSSDVQERLKRGFKEAIDLLLSLKRDALDEDINRLAYTESLDEEVANLISQAVIELGRNVAITVEDSNKVGLSLETVKGMRFKKGLISEGFVNDADRGRCVLTEPYILIADRRIATNSQIRNFLESIIFKGKTDLLIVALDVEGEALASLLMNHQRRAMNIACIQAPYKGQAQKDFLTDLAVLTGGKVISEESGMFLDKVLDVARDVEGRVIAVKSGMEILGTATQVIVDKDETTISGGKADETLLAGRVSVIKQRIEETVDYERQVAIERLAGLTSGIAVIKVGAFTVDEQRLKRDKIEDAINSVRQACEEGIVAGGGSDLVRVAAKHSDPLFQKILCAPFEQMALNSGMGRKKFFGLVDTTKRMTKKVKQSKPGFGYDFKNKRPINMYNYGIIDAFKIERMALETAFSITSIFVDLGVFCAEFPEKQPNE